MIEHDLTESELAWLAGRCPAGRSCWNRIQTEQGAIQQAEVRFQQGQIVSATAAEPRWTVQQIIRAVYDATARRAARRSTAARKAATTRQQRQDALVYQLAQRWAATGQFVPSRRCRLCRKLLDDPQAIQRGIGSDCWQRILAVAEQLLSQQQQQGGATP